MTAAQAEPEFSRTIKIRPLPAEPLELAASEVERQALAQRFGLAGIKMLEASVSLKQEGKAVRADGELTARISQLCAISAEEFPVRVEEGLAFRFVQEQDLAPVETADEEIEIELTADELDEIPFSGDSFDLGEAIAQSLGLAIDPYAEGPNADAAREMAGITGDDTPSGPLAEALSALKRD